MDNITPYNPEMHKDMLILWAGGRGLPSSLMENLPKYGFIINKIAAGFLRRCEGNHVLLDSLISNPNATAAERNQAIDIIVENLLKLAKSMGYEKILAFSTDKNTLMRSERHGFEKLPHTVIVAPLLK